MKKERLVLGHLSKTEGVDYLSDAQYISSTLPGPSTYKSDAKVVQPRVTAVKFAPTKSKKQSSWKPVKSQEPDCGTYQVDRARATIEKSPITHKISKISPISNSAPRLKEDGSGPSKLGKNSSKETFTTIMTKQKRWLPGVGSYTPKVEFIDKPYSRKRM